MKRLLAFAFTCLLSSGVTYSYTGYAHWLAAPVGMPGEYVAYFPVLSKPPCPAPVGTLYQLKPPHPWSGKRYIITGVQYYPDGRLMGCGSSPADEYGRRLYCAGGYCTPFDGVPNEQQ
jgi:hypothetical protein